MENRVKSETEKDNAGMRILKNRRNRRNGSHKSNPQTGAQPKL
jgi:hypothetical protein